VQDGAAPQGKPAGTSAGALCASSALLRFKLSLPRGTLHFPTEQMGVAEHVESKALAWHWFKNNSFYANTVITGTLSVNVVIENIPVQATSSIKITSSTVGMVIRHMNTIFF